MSPIVEIRIRWPGVAGEGRSNGISMPDAPEPLDP